MHAMDSTVNESIQGVLGFKSCIPASTSLHNLTSRLRRKFYKEEPGIEVREVSPNGIWAYDATWALAEAVERAKIKNSTRSSQHGVMLLREILQKRSKGLSGEIQFLNGKLISGALFGMVNVIGKEERRSKIWPSRERNTKELHLLNDRRNLLSTYDLKRIVWPRGSKAIMKSSKRRLSNEIKLRIGVPVKLGFKELVDVFKAVIEALPYKVHYEFIPFEDANGNMAGTYNELVYQVHLQKFDAVVGDTTITWNRSLYVDFTVPFTDLGTGTLVPKEDETMWIFLKPLSADLWITSAGFFILTGFVVWIIEKPINQEFQGSPSQQIGTIFWFSFSTLVFAHREKLLNNSAKFVVIIWVFVVLILNSSYTATLASMMTVKQIQLNSKLDYVGYQIGTFTKLGLIDFDFKGIEQFNQSEEAYIDALSRGNKPGGASAIIDEIPYIKIFLAKYSSKYSMINTKSTTNGFGFVFPKGSKLAQDMSRQIEILREEGKLLEMEEAWFHSKSNLLFDDKTSDPSALNFHSFRGLFLVSGFSSAFALLLFTVFSLKEKYWHLVKKKYWQHVRKVLSKKVFNENEETTVQDAS
ncbi:glutamate receptor 1.3 [Prunus yedoensis var. nudiflora]|uniref:Glutamate receptor 1.3 n=1 Tax=Prunus yedoensis var. nudiflora TaxID=2094558 RepID=A0A314UJ05_PRUYE|nr:glutamate receptor 1.3 [Prunus yedoensis var. nudiflora]